MVDDLSSCISFYLRSFRLFIRVRYLTESTFRNNFEANRITFRVTKYWKNESFSLWILFSVFNGSVLLSIASLSAIRFGWFYFFLWDRFLFARSLSFSYIIFKCWRALSFPSIISLTFLHFGWEAEGDDYFIMMSFVLKRDLFSMLNGDSMPDETRRIESSFSLI